MASRRAAFARNLSESAGKIGDTLGTVYGTILNTSQRLVSISGDALDNAKVTSKKLVNQAQSTSSELAHQASCLAMEARHQAQKLRLRTRLYIAEKPANAVAIVAGAAFLGGLLLGLRRRK